MTQPPLPPPAPQAPQPRPPGPGSVPWAGGQRVQGSVSRGSGVGQPVDAPTRPPTWDPAHYGYGPARPTTKPERPETAVVEAPPSRWGLLRGPLGAAALGAAVMSLLFAGLWFAVGGNSTTNATVVEFPELGPSTILDGDVLDIQGVLAKVRPSVVTINTGSESSAGLFTGAGSGVVIRDNGVILTNAHVIADADTIEVSFFDGTVTEAEVMGQFPDDDIAIIRAIGISGLLPADLGSSEDLRVGDDVVAIGNALDLGSTPSVTKGIVSAKDRTISDQFVRLESLIQTDAAINPGNSGGPLVNAAGEVVGINTAIIDDAQNIGFAISIDVVEPLIERALAGDADISPDTAFLGLSTITVGDLGDAVVEQFSVAAGEGAFVQEVVASSPAEGAGMQRGDVVVALGGEPVTSAADVARIVRSHRPGAVVAVDFERAGAIQRIEIELGTR